MLANFLTPEILLIAVVMAVIVVVFFFMLVSNKLSSIDSQMTEVRDGMDQRINQSIKALSDQLHDDVITRSKVTEESLSQMGDSWRSSLNKTVTDMRSEIGRLQSELSSDNKTLHDTLVEHMIDHSVEINENLALVRDNNHQEVQAYHQQLANQVREHAAGERDSLNQTLGEISEAVKANLTTLATNQSDTLLGVTDKISTGYENVNNRVRDTIKKVTSKVTKDFSNITKQVDSTISNFDDMVKKDLQAVGNEVSSSLSNITSKLDNSVNSISTDLNKNLSQLTADVDSKMLGSIEKLDKELTTATTKLDSSIDGINESVREGIEKFGTTITVNFDSIEGKINKRIHKELQGLLDIFRGFADKVELIQETQNRINQLADNVNVLAQTLDDRRARGTVGEVVVESIIKDNLSPGDYELNTELSNGTKIDCLMRLPKPSGNVAISTAIDLSDIEVINTVGTKNKDLNQARTKFAKKLAKAINDTALNCIIEGETAEGAVLLLANEAAFSEAHVNHRELVDHAYASKVWIASPATLLAMTTVTRSVIKDGNAREEMLMVRRRIRDITNEYSLLDSDIRHLDAEIETLHRSIDDTRRSVRKVGKHLGDLDTQLRDSPELRHYLGDDIDEGEDEEEDTEV